MKSLQRRFLCLAVVSALVLAAAPWIGAYHVTPMGILGEWTDTQRQVLLQVRLPRVLLGFLAGCGLAMSGMAFQGVFRNPLATPYTLGASSGAALGAALCVWLGLDRRFPGIPLTSVAAFGGALGAISLVYGLTRVARGFATATLLLAGIAVSLFCSSLILLVQYVSNLSDSFRIIRWMMGGLEVVGVGAVLRLAPFVMAGGLVLAFLSRELNLLTLGDDLALSRGVRVGFIKKLLFVSTSLMVGGIVALCGPIGFVGMMVPHMCRLIVGADHRILLPAVALFGGSFLVLCDTFARTVAAPAEVPVGVITALLGGPFFVWLLVTRPFGTGEKQ